MLTHEAFMFIGVAPTSLLLYNYFPYKNERSKRSLVISYVSWNIAIFLLCCVFKGNAQIVANIWEGLSPTDRAIISVNDAPNGGIAALTWTILGAMKLPLSVFASGFAWYWIFATLASAYYLVALSTLEIDQRASNPEQIASILSLYTAAFLPVSALFFEGWDWGRWISVVSNTVIILFFSDLHCIRFEWLRAKMMRLHIPSPSSHLTKPVLAVVCIVFAITFKLPECCFGGSGDLYTEVGRKLISALFSTQ
jgi:hypothetical protein